MKEEANKIMMMKTCMMGEELHQWPLRFLSINEAPLRCSFHSQHQWPAQDIRNLSEFSLLINNLTHQNHK